MTDIRKFRHDISILKKQGLIPKSVDARSALPDKKIKGKKLSTLVRKFDDVVSGKATAVKVPASTLKAHRKIGDEIVNGRLIVPHSATQKVTLKNKQVVIISKSGIERVQLPVEFHNVRQYLTDLKKQSSEIDRLKGTNEYFAIRFRGGQRANFYSDIRALLSDLSKYDAIQGHIGRPKELEFYRNLEIVRMSKRSAVKFESELGTKKQSKRTTAKGKRKKKPLGPVGMARRSEQIKKESQAYRDGLSGKRLEQYKAKARKRAAKSRAKKKTKKKSKKK